MGRRSGARVRHLALAAPVMLCAFAILLSFAFVRGGLEGTEPPMEGAESDWRAAAGDGADGADGDDVANGGDGGEAGDGDAAANNDGSRAGEAPAAEELLDGLVQDGGMVREALDAPASPSAPDAFLTDLSRSAESVGAVEWGDAKGLEHAGREVLGAYREAGASLRMDGFLDLHGTAWAAILQGDEWVDVVSITGPHEGAASVRVVRIRG